MWFGVERRRGGGWAQTRLMGRDRSKKLLQKLTGVGPPIHDPASAPDVGDITQKFDIVKCHMRLHETWVELCTITWLIDRLQSGSLYALGTAPPPRGAKRPLGDPIDGEELAGDDLNPAEREAADEAAAADL